MQNSRDSRLLKWALAKTVIECLNLCVCNCENCQWSRNCDNDNGKANCQRGFKPSKHRTCMMIDLHRFNAWTNTDWLTLTWFRSHFCANVFQMNCPLSTNYDMNNDFQANAFLFALSQKSQLKTFWMLNISFVSDLFGCSHEFRPYAFPTECHAAEVDSFSQC